MAKKFFKTTLTFEVLSEEPIPDDIELEEVAREAQEGSYVGRMGPRWETELCGRSVVTSLYEFGSEPGFFMLDESGQEVD